MKSSLRPQIAFLLAVTLALLAGCESTGRSARIQEKSAVFSALSPARQEQIKEGSVDFGFTQDMVYIALGKPSRVENSANGRDVTWVFPNYYPPDSMRSTGVLVRRIGNTRKVAPVGANSSTASGFSSASQETSMELPDMASFTLYVVFRKNKVIDLLIGDEQ